MKSNEQDDGLDLLLREAEPLERGLGHRRANHLVAGEGSVRGRCRRLSDVVKQSREPHDEVGRDPLYGEQRMAVYVVSVIASLLHPLAGGYFGEDDVEQPTRVEQLEGEPRALGRQHPTQLVRSALDRDHRWSEPALELPHRRQHVRRQLETELGGKSHGAEHAEGIVGEGAQWVAWGAQDPRLQILSPAERVLDPAVEVHQQRVDREVPPAQVLLQGGRAHVRLSRLGRVRLGTSGDELDQVAGEADLRGAVALERDRRPRLCELGESLSELERITVFHDHIRIRMRAAEELVADVATDDPSPEAEVARGLLEEADQLVVA